VPLLPHYLLVFPFPLGGVDVLGAVSLFQDLSECWQLLLIPKGRHHSGQCPKYGRGLLSEASTLLLKEESRREVTLF